MTRPLGSTTPSSDNDLIVPHQLALGVTLGDVISAIDLCAVAPGLIERSDSVVRVFQ